MSKGVMAAKSFRNCVHTCQHYLTPDDLHDLCFICLGEEHAYDELLEVMCYVTDRLDLPWRHERCEIACGRLDERFLSGHNLYVIVIQLSQAFCFFQICMLRWKDLGRKHIWPTLIYLE